MVYLPLFDGARNWATQGVINYFEIFSRRVAASSNKYFYRYQPPTPAKDLLAEFWRLEREAESLLKGLAE
jgi:hypothetical protein